LPKGVDPALPEKNAKKPRIPRYLPVCFAWVFGLQLIVYYGTRLLPSPAPHDLSTAWDRAIPLIPAWVAVYFLAYITWAAGFWRILTAERVRGIRVAFAYGIALICCGVCFVLFPCTMTRPAVVGDGFFAELTRFLYRVDAPANLLPSIHVLASYFCWRGTVGCRAIGRGEKILFFVFFLLVCLSVLFVRQHVLADIPTAVLTAELCLLLARAVRPERVFRERA
jgi:hypothetical protein